MEARVDRSAIRRRIRHRIRKRVGGTDVRPRLAVFRSEKHIYAQVIDDGLGRTIAQASTLDPELRPGKAGGNVAAAKAVGTAIAKKLVEGGIERVVFDRGGFRYHGRVKALADAARESGLKF